LPLVDLPIPLHISIGSTKNSDHFQKAACEVVIDPLNILAQGELRRFAATDTSVRRNMAARLSKIGQFFTVELKAPAASLRLDSGLLLLICP
jgi:hypothetical protein